MNNRVETVVLILLNPFMSHDHLSGHHRGWKQKLRVWQKYWIAFYYFVASQGLHTYQEGFTLHTMFTTSLEVKTCGCQRKDSQWQYNSLERRDFTMVTTHHDGFTPRTLFPMQKTEDKGTILNGCCLSFLAAFFQRGSALPLIAIVRLTITNFEGIQTNALIIIRTHIVALLSWWSTIGKASERFTFMNLTTLSLKLRQNI